jgi:hypothetical protein
MLSPALYVDRAYTLFESGNKRIFCAAGTLFYSRSVGVEIAGLIGDSQPHSRYLSAQPLPGKRCASASAITCLD